ncbi:MAG: HEAT repeat domain-containing protein [Planctomycetota bacterium]|jgi:HEAT repeat protein
MKYIVSVLALSSALWGACNRPEGTEKWADEIKSSDPNTRIRAARSLGQIGSREGIGALMVALRDPVGEVRFAAAEALGTMEEDAAPAAEALIVAGNDELESVRKKCWWAVQQIGRDAVPALKKSLASPRRELRKSAAKAAQLLGADAIGAVPFLVSSLSEAPSGISREEREVLESADLAYRNFADFSLEVAKALAAMGLGALGPLTKALGSTSAGMRSRASLAIGIMEPAEAHNAVLTLARLLGDSEEDVRACAVWALGRIGPGASDALPAIEELIGDSSMGDSTRESALAAMKRIGGR